jgi:hypothetical protein
MEGHGRLLSPELEVTVAFSRKDPRETSCLRTVNEIDVIRKVCPEEETEGKFHQNWS